MKKALALGLVFSAFTVMTLAITPSMAQANCGKCGVESEHKACCSHKHWYNPVSWFKKCETCVPKQEG